MLGRETRSGNSPEGALLGWSCFGGRTLGVLVIAASRFSVRGGPGRVLLLTY